MIKSIFKIVLVLMLLVTFNGCASMGKPKDLQIQGLRNQVSALQAQIEYKDREIEALRDGLVSTQENKVSVKRKKEVQEVKSRPNSKQIQTALRNAGYDPGKIDGKIGKRTKEAIRAFQGSKGLKVDGKVGKQTWGELEAYLYKTAK
ncbi:MAG: peptidoglycan-binding protein [Candidatus Omnitrophica bacterium]|nr:peptidoglycan-binding protein [Candidatus Omnitrophota bacterium]MBU1906305.1 peptidoglycan-binding protein [Candidatus Omnitrophota bacterium]